MIRLKKRTNNLRNIFKILKKVSSAEKKEHQLQQQQEFSRQKKLLSTANTVHPPPPPHLPPPAKKNIYIYIKRSNTRSRQTKHSENKRKKNTLFNYLNKDAKRNKQ